jgi:glyoxylase-like metal-dependent hydrolase (beta-lactamase superfamily II)
MPSARPTSSKRFVNSFALFVLAIAVLVVGQASWRSSRRVSARAVPRRSAEPVGAISMLAPHLYVISGGGCNTAMFVTAAGVVLVDPKYAESWPAVQAQIATITDKPIAYVINTHAHPDHTEANRVLPADVTLVMHENAVRHVTGSIPTSAVTRLETYTTRLTLFSGEEAVDLYHFGPAHTDGDTFVVFRSARVMHAGDVFAARSTPIINHASGGNGVTFADVVKHAAHIPQVDRVITGHGPVVPWSDFVLFADLNRRLLEHVRSHMHVGADKAAVFRSFTWSPQFSGFERARAFDTMDEIDRSLRPWWQRVW